MSKFNVGDKVMFVAARRDKKDDIWFDGIGVVKSMDTAACPAYYRVMAQRLGKTTNVLTLEHEIEFYQPGKSEVTFPDPVSKDDTLFYGGIKYVVKQSLEWVVAQE